MKRLSLSCMALLSSLVLSACGGGGGGDHGGILEDPDVRILEAGVHEAASMHTPRNFPLAVRLQDGRVLVVGGTSLTTRAEIYDPQADTWTETAPLQVPHHSSATVNLLPDGRVLIASGRDAFNINEIYDPATDTVTPAPGFEIPRRGQQSASLPDGRILFLGGRDADFGGNVLDSLEIYDPRTNRMKLHPSRELGVRSSALMVALADGRVLIAGGGRSSTWTYDPGTDAVTRTAAVFPSLATWSPRAARLADGRVLVAGSLARYPSGLLYDPLVDRWVDSGVMLEPRSSNAVTALDDGGLLVTGGTVDDGPADTTGTERYDPATGTFAASFALPETRRSHVAVRLLDGSVLVCGGIVNRNETAASCLRIVLD